MNPAPEHLRKFEWYLPHQAWLAQQHGSSRHDSESEEDADRAYLRGDHLHDVDLSGADLRFAVLLGSVLSYANLSNADLSYADLSEADLSFADLRGANLSYTNLSEADLSFANLRGANLSYAKLNKAHLEEADFLGADLRSADLRDVSSILDTDAVFTGCNLSGAKLGEYLIEYIAENYPAEYLGYVLSLG